MSNKEKLVARYEAAMRKMQAGVAHELSSREEGAKSLRVGVNSALVDSSSLGLLLMRKGLISEEEYLTALAEGMEREVARYQARLDAHYGPGRVLLGGTLEDL